MTDRRVAIVQSSYIPWRGYFSLIAACDTFIFLDSVQFTKRDWRSRNRLRTANANVWLSIPLIQRGFYLAAIDEMTVSDPLWADAHWRRIEDAYRKAPAFQEAAPVIKEAYASVADLDRLSAINIALVRSLCAALAIDTGLMRDTELFPRTDLVAMDATDRLVELCRASRASHYLSGPAARSYLDEERFRAAGIQIEWADYSGLRPYPQLHGGFDPQVSIVDTVLNLGYERTRLALEGIRTT